TSKCGTDCASDRGPWSYDPDLARAARPCWRDRGWSLEQLDDQGRNVMSGRQHVVKQRGRCWGAIVRECDLLHQRAGDALHNAARDLTLDNRRIYEASTIGYRRIPDEADRPGRRIDIGDSDMRTVGERVRRGIDGRGRLQRRFCFFEAQLSTLNGRSDD